MRRALLAVTALASLMLTSCEVYTTKRVEFKNHPVALYVVSKVIDEEKVEYTVKFRNTGKEVMSFDYTISDEGGVPHVDAEGPNSGLVENLYPGAEVEVPNPMNRMTVWATLGTVTYGRQTKPQISSIYKPGSMMGVLPDGEIPSSLLPQPPPPPTVQ
jgi:hypothetical protein